MTLLSSNLATKSLRTQQDFGGMVHAVTFADQIAFRDRLMTSDADTNFCPSILPGVAR